MNRPATILVADDDRSIRTVVSQALTRAGFDVLATGSAGGLWHWIENGQGDAVITDVVMPDADGLELLPKIRKIRPELPVIVMSAQNTLETAVKAAERGAYEYLPKPFDIDELTETVGRALAKRQLTGAADAAAALRDKAPLIGGSPAMQQVYKVMARVMATDLTVLIQGESGTGKELVARALHEMGPRRDAPFVAVNMAAIPRELIESELFGHEKGAFTGAGERAPGRFAQAHKGTLFLDEIADMPRDAQTRLLRVLQEGEYRSVGGRAPVSVDIRIVAASNRNLKALVRDGGFREDLFYRLNVVPLLLPPLRLRTGDIDDLVERFLDEAEADGLPPKKLEEGALKLLRAHPWPGNVRELKNLIRRLSALYAEDLITAEVVAGELQDDEAGPEAPGPGSGGLGDTVHTHLARYFAAHANSLPPAGLYGRVLREIEKPLIELTLTATRGNQVKAAAILGLNRNTLRKKITELGVNLP